MMTRPFTPRLLWPLLAAALIVSWSSGFIGIRLASEEAGVMLVLFWRTLMSGLLLLPLALLRGPRLTVRVVAEQMVFGVMVVFLYLGGFALAIGQRVPTGLVALISDLVPLAIAALSQPLLGERLRGRQWLGTGIGVAGVLIVSQDSLRLGHAPLWAYGVTVAAMLVFALATMLQKRRGMLQLPVYQTLCIQSLTGAALFGLAALAEGDITPPATPGFLLGVGWLVIFSTFFCYSIYYIALRLYPAAQVSSVIYLSPPVTMIWGWLMFDEPLTGLMFLGLAVTLVGVWLTSARTLPRAANRGRNAPDAFGDQVRLDG